jgi:hypothetical protein
MVTICLIPLLACVCATRQQIDACQDDTSCLACLSSGDAGDADFNVEQGCSVAGRAHMRKLAYEKSSYSMQACIMYLQQPAGAYCNTWSVQALSVPLSVCFCAALVSTTAYREYLTTRMTAACKADANKSGSTLSGILDCQANTVEAACNTYATLSRCKDEVRLHIHHHICTHA